MTKAPTVRTWNGPDRPRDTFAKATAVLMQVAASMARAGRQSDAQAIRAALDLAEGFWDPDRTAQKFVAVSPTKEETP